MDRRKSKTMRILITGATGLLGNNLVRMALEDGHEVVALIRQATTPISLSGLSVEVHLGDIGDATSLRRAAKGVDAILHSAAFIHIGWTKLEESIEANVDGTRNVAEAAMENDAKLIHISTVNTLAIGDREGTAHEETEGDGQVPCSYVVSKRAAEKATEAAIQKGLSACIVHPGFMLGPWDWKPSSGRMLLQVGKYWTPLAPSGGCSVCDVRDVARGVLLAMERGLTGRHYILAGENMTYFQLWARMKRLHNKRSPLTYMRWPGRVLAGTVGDIQAWLSGSESDINSAALRMSSQFHCYSSQRAIDELGYTFRSADEALQEAHRWFSEYGYLN
jgi:dihydroflavonol-4-reductase